MKLKHPFMAKKVDIPKNHSDDVDNIRSWLAHQPHLPKLTDEHIMMFLHSCYYSGERTKTTIDNYYTVRAQCSDLFTGWTWDVLKSSFDMYTMTELPRLTPEGYRVLLYRMRDTDPSKLVFNDALKTFFAFNDVCISEDGLLPGYVVVFDMKGLCLGHLARVSTCMSAVRKFMIYIQDCHPVRLKGVHVINTFSLIDKILCLVKPLMQSDLIQLLHLHPDVNTLNEFVPLDIMPLDYGGTTKHTDQLHKDTTELIEGKYLKWLEQSEAYTADLKKRIGKPRNQLIGLELEGSFKSLSFD
ncbi:alpha-tocopherol transfer protein [Nilaparvata lugens]|uniref:alpha-tocopherol transfer protein n=1 Tax=Nilaparvata lugens TaxID=108931 RepID=UPI000B986E30|nr:alpha-tocopherol transfer protein [Nilaparvata lugens]